MKNLTMLAALFALWLVFMSPSELVPFPAVVFVTFVGGCSSGVVPLLVLVLVQQWCCASGRTNRRGELLVHSQQDWASF